MYPANIIPGFFISLFAGWLYYHLRSVFGGILIHALFSLISLAIFSYSTGTQFLRIAPFFHNSQVYKLVVTAMVFIFAAGVVYLQYYFTNNKASSNKLIK
jgi:hypothetical protein